MFFVYALYSEDSNKIYIGYSSDPDKRLFSHNDERSSGWTSKFRPWKLIYTEKCVSKTAALIREKQLKTSRGRDFVWSYITNNKTHFEHEAAGLVRQLTDDRVVRQLADGSTPVQPTF